ncbi:MAG: hypothetical protein AAF942_04840 [Pseudomonadota bacterium]
MIPAEEDIESIQCGRRKAGLAFILCAALLVACGSPATFYVGSAVLANFVYTDKLPTDYLAELATGEECSLLKSQEDGGPFCRESFQERIVYEAPLYCYRTLGEITCYNKRNPYGPTSTEVR